MKDSVLVGLSGGIDSTATALLLKEQGYKVTGVHLQLFEEDNSDYREKLEYISNRLGIEWIDYNAIGLFKEEVIGYFTKYHLEGKTPSPCTHCNPHVKWKLLQEVADGAGIDKIATGHYIRIIKENGLYRIYRGIDGPKDQSYYMWQLSQEVLSRALTPLGDYTKMEIRKLAEKAGFDQLASSKESAGLCFARGRSCDELLKETIPGLEQKIKPGKVLDGKGQEIGTHKGYIYYTIGQKKDLQLKGKEKLCVAKIDPENNILVAKPWQELYETEFHISEYTFANMEETLGNKELQVMVRGFGLNPEGSAKLEKMNESLIKVNLENPAWAIAPGQPAVFYSNDKLLGGGVIV